MAFHDTSNGSGCQECGRAMAKAKKVHEGKRYCATCYPRLFKRRVCARCGNFARLPVFDLAANCISCDRAGPCVRCGKAQFEKGMRSPYGPVCKPCVPYFREAEVCEVCGVLSQRLARNSTTGLRTCPKCSGPAMATCPSCRRHRVLVSGHDGVSRCEACTVEGERSCETCSMQMPAGRGRECESCYWLKLFNKRLAINVKGFSSDHFEQLFARFGQWLLERSGAQKAALNINGHYRFFREVDTTWGSIPSYGQLLEQFGATRLRRAENPMLWLSELKTVSVNADLREQHTEKRRVHLILAELDEPWSQQLLRDYLAMLTGRMESGDTDLRSIRLAIRAAANLLKCAMLSLGELPTQKMLKLFWRNSPGQVAAVTGFIGYLNKAYNLDLQARPDDRWLAKAKRHKAERELVALLGDDQQGDFEARWIVKGLAYFHGVGRASQKTLRYEVESFQGVAGFSVQRDGQTLWVPSAASFRRGDSSE